MMIDKNAKHYCRYCGKEYNRVRDGHLYCSAKCRVYAHRMVKKEMNGLNDGVTIKKAIEGDGPIINIRVDTLLRIFNVSCYNCNRVSEFDLNVLKPGDEEKVIFCLYCNNQLVSVMSKGYGVNKNG